MLERTNIFSSLLGSTMQGQDGSYLYYYYNLQFPYTFDYALNQLIDHFFYFS